MTSSKSRWPDFVPIALVSGLNLVLHLVAIRGFGFFRDELYYIACSDHLAWGFVDQPPLSILVLKMVRLLFGDSPVAVRILPALGGAAFVLLTGLIARELGGKRFALLLASAAGFAPVGNLFQFHVYSMNFLDLIFWQVCVLILIRLVKTENPKLWVPFGIVLGMGLQNKVSLLLLVLGLGVGLLLTKRRRDLKSRHFWLGVALAVLIFLPYLIWNFTHGWPTLEWMHNAEAHKNVKDPPLIFLISQVFYNNPLSILVWLPGLWYFFFHREGRRYRLFGWLTLSLLLLIMFQGGKDYYLAGIYPVLFAGGALLIESAFRPRAKRVLGPALMFLLIGSTLFFSPFGLPVLSVEKTVAYVKASGINRSQEGLELGGLPQHFADMFGWEELAATIAGIQAGLPPDEQRRCLIYVRNYGEAAAVDYYGKKYGLPKASCPHNSYWLWGPPQWDGGVAIIIGESRDPQTSLADLKPHFESVEQAASTSCSYCMPYENNRPIFLCRGAKFSFRQIWPEEKNFI
jgi:4-amino-4-deoxy-L-arabinose transferase-like glycosyltransferase